MGVTRWSGNGRDRADGTNRTNEVTGAGDRAAGVWREVTGWWVCAPVCYVGWDDDPVVRLVRLASTTGLSLHYTPSRSRLRHRVSGGPNHPRGTRKGAWIDRTTGRACKHAG
jgi:hypothetical protein